MVNDTPLYVIVLDVKPDILYRMMRDLFEKGLPLTMLVTRQNFEPLMFHKNAFLRFACLMDFSDPGR